MIFEQIIAQHSSQVLKTLRVHDLTQRRDTLTVAWHQDQVHFTSISLPCILYVCWWWSRYFCRNDFVCLLLLPRTRYWVHSCKCVFSTLLRSDSSAYLATAVVHLLNFRFLSDYLWMWENNVCSLYSPSSLFSELFTPWSLKTSLSATTMYLIRGASQIIN